MSQDVMAAVHAEVSNANSKWGHVTGRSAYLWATILAEETGEVAKAVHDIEFAHGTIEELRHELAQVAATAIRWMEDLNG